MTVTTASNAAVIQTAIQRTLEQESVLLSSGVRIVDSAAPGRFPHADQ